MSHVKFTFKTRSWAVATAVAMLGAVVPADAIGQGHPSTQVASGPPACTASGSSSPPPPLASTTVDTIRQAYSCILGHYYNATALDDRRLLDGAFAGLTQELDRLGLEQADATMPALSGDQDKDWSAFATVYERVTNRLPATAAVRQAVASATMTALVDSLGDDHAGWQRPLFPPGQQPGEMYGIGLTTSPAGPLFSGVPTETLPPLFVASVLGGPAAAQDVRPGDVIEAVDDQSPFLQGKPNPGVGSLLNQMYPQSDPVRLTLRRPSTGRTRIVTLKPMLYTPTGAASQAVTSTLSSGNIADIQLRMFAPGAAEAVFKAIADLGGSGTLRGIVLDLRGDGGGSPPEVAKLLGAFVHSAAWSYDCTRPDRCDVANRTGSTVPLLRLPLVVLTDRSCASACDAFSAAVKDLHLGTLVGTRTAGVVAGQASPWWLGDGSVLTLPSTHEVGADHEMIDGIGVAPDIYLPTTPEDLSTGHDAVLAKALSLLEH